MAIDATKVRYHFRGQERRNVTISCAEIHPAQIIHAPKWSTFHLLKKSAQYRGFPAKPGGRSCAPSSFWWSAKMTAGMS